MNIYRFSQTVIIRYGNGFLHKRKDEDDMDHMLNARSLFGTTMGFHIIYATLGIGLPLMMLIAELLYQKTKDIDYAIMAKRWTKTFAVLLGVGIPTGTIASVQLSLLWPGFMEVVGKVIALPFQLEIYAFFLEALFMTIYVYAADRISSFMRIVSLFFVAIGAALSAALITNVHAFQETPSGFTITNGEITNVDPWAAFFNPIFLNTAYHVITSAFVVGAFIISTIAAYKLLKKNGSKREYAFHKKALMMAIIVGGIFSFLTALNGHESAIELYKYQPEKLAAAEGLFETRANAPLAVGGIADPNTETVKWAVQIPGLLSVLATGTTSGVIKGLNEFPREEWPPLFIHLLFDSMVGIGTLLILLSLTAIGFRMIKKHLDFPRWLLYAFVSSGPLALLSIESGWIFSCVGRYPWTIYRILHIDDAVTTTGNIGLFFIIFIGLYVFLSIGVIYIIRYYFKHHPLMDDLEQVK